MFAVSKPLASPYGAALVLAAAGFVTGLSAGPLILPAARNAGVSATAVTAPAPHLPRAAYPAEVLRVIDGDTFEARVRVWPGTDITTRVRLRRIDAAELHARCDEERVKAVAAREALARILAEGAIGIANVGIDKFGGRVDADVSTARTPDVSAAMLQGGYARAYAGGRRAGWCG